MSLPMLQPGWRVEMGTHTFSAEEIVSFARKYDPQPFHLDQEAARKSIFGRLCASGWHTAAMWMRYRRLYFNELEKQLRDAGQPSFEQGPAFGIEKLRWRLPVYAGDSITFYSETTACRESRSRERWYVTTSALGGVNQDGRVVIEFAGSSLIRYPA